MDNKGAKMVYTSEQFLLDSYAELTSSICDLDKNIVSTNMDVIANLNESDRKLSLETAVFIASHFVSMCMLMVLDYNDARNVFADALNRETKIYENNLSYTNDKDGLFTQSRQKSGLIPGSGHSMEIGSTIFSQSVIATLIQYVQENMSFVMTSFEKNHKDYCDLYEINIQNQKDVFVCKLILSNFGYMLKAFMLNGQFVKKISELVKDFENSLI